jgi:hypothetical protein
MDLNLTRYYYAISGEFLSQGEADRDSSSSGTIFALRVPWV